MSDNTELKRLAELLHGAEWQLVDGDGFDADNRFVTSQRRIDDNKVAFAEINYGHPEAGMGEPFQSEQVAAGEFIAAANPAAVLALIAENELLEIERAELWRGKRDVEATRDTKSAVIAELKAEIAGLRTGYEAYERVNAELKAECARSTEREILQLAEIEALRNALRPLLANWDDLRPGESLNVDAARAAMDKGDRP